MQLPSEKDLQWFDRNGVERPSHEEHGQFDPSLLVRMKATRWWLEGNILCANTNHGILKQSIPTDYICRGMDNKGLPILEKIDIK